MSDRDGASSPKDVPVRKKSDRDLLAALVSGVVGALALATSTYNVYLTRQQVRAEVWPKLVWEVNVLNDDLAFTLQNRGVGPADVRRVRVKVDGASVADWIQAEQKLLGEQSVPMPNELPEITTTIRPGQDVTAFRMNDDTTVRRLLAERRRLEVEICYCSSLAECWTVSARGTSPNVTRPVRRCEPDPTPFVALREKAFDAYLDASAPKRVDRSGADAKRGSAGK